MKHRLINLFAVFSLILGAAAMAFWIKSRSPRDVSTDQSARDVRNVESLIDDIHFGTQADLLATRPNWGLASPDRNDEPIPEPPEMELRDVQGHSFPITPYRWPE